MPKKFQLQIPDPCHEDWDKMTPVDKGRFCDSCQKPVIDFTGMSDTQLIAFFKKPSTGSVCGRFFDDQLNRNYEMPRKRVPWLKYAFQFVIPVFLGSFKTYSQGKPFKINDTTSVCMKTNANEPVILGNLRPMTLNEILGKVTDESGNGVSYATVYIKGTKNGVACDSAGNFYLRIPGISSKLVLVSSCIGFEPSETSVNLNSLPEVRIVLRPDKNTNTGVVVTAYGSVKKGGVMGAVTTVRRSYLVRVKDFFTKDSVNVFPNPAKSGNEIKIEWKKFKVGEYAFELYSIQGQLIKATTVKIDSETSFTNFQLPIVIPGTYILRITNKNSGKLQSEKIIIQ